MSTLRPGRHKCSYLKKYSTDFRKLSEGRGRRVFWLKISSGQVFLFGNSKVITFPTSTKCDIFQFLEIKHGRRNATDAPDPR